MANEEILKTKGRLLASAESNPIKFVSKLVKESDTDLAEAASRWRRYRAKYRMGLKYLEDLSSKPLVHPVNYLFGTVRTVLAHVPKSLPSMQVKSPDADDKLGDSLLSKLLRFSLVEQGRLRQVIKQKALAHAAICGYSWLEVTVAEDRFGNPDNAIQAYPPEAILVDPNALPFYDERGRVTARYLIKRRRDVSLEEVEALFPKFEVKLNENGEIEDFHSSLDESLTDTLGTFRNRKRSQLGIVGDLLECWINTFKEDKPWYRIVIWGNKVVKKVHPSPYDHPYPTLVPIWDGYDDGADNFYMSGIGEVEEIEPLQDKANMMDLQIFKNIRQITNRQRVVNKGLGLNTANVDNTDGRVYAVPGNPKDAIHWDNPQMLSTDVYTYRMLVDYAVELVSGVTGTQAGRKPTGIQAAKAITQLTMNSDKRMEDKREDISFAIERLGEIGLSNIFQYWTSKRTVQLLDGESTVVIGEYPDNLKKPENFDTLDEEQQQQIVATQEEWKQANGINLVLADLKRNSFIRVSTDSPLPEDRDERLQLHADALKLGAIDRRAFLEGTDWPERDDILKRLAEADTGKSASDGGLAQDQQSGQLLQMLMQLLMQGQMQGGQGAPAPAPAQLPAPAPAETAVPEGDIPPEILAQMLGQ